MTVQNIWDSLLAQRKEKNADPDIIFGMRAVHQFVRRNVLKKEAVIDSEILATIRATAQELHNAYYGEKHGLFGFDKDHKDFCELMEKTNSVL